MQQYSAKMPLRQFPSIFSSLLLLFLQNTMRLLLVFVLAAVALAQSCRSPTNESVDWFLLLNAPGSLSEGYLYFDSQSTGNVFAKHQAKSDAAGQPLMTTLQQINANPNLSFMAWNDQNPNGTTSSVKAHSKTVFLYDSSASTGIVLVHSIPKYPSFLDNLVNATISDSERIYGQHVFCLRVSLSIMADLIDKSSIIRRNVYAKNVDIPAERKSQSLFEYADFSMANTNFKIIYKNGYINGSIFEDGITAMLNSDLLAESWGRPIQDPWCGDSDNPHCTGNSEMIQFEEGFEWKRTQDHAKWAVPIRDGVEFSCLGDMNRMVSQWKRGGGFYCIQNERLRSALRNLIVEQETCS